MAVKICHGQMSSSLCRNISLCRKKVSGTKMINLDNCEMFREKKRSVPERNLLHSSYRGVVVSYDNVVVGIRGIEPCLKTGVNLMG
jgi:hypothetical protein